MNFLILITLAKALCATVVTPDDTEFESVLATAEQYNYVSLDAYPSGLPVGSEVFEQTFVVNDRVYTCGVR